MLRNGKKFLLGATSLMLGTFLVACGDDTDNGTDTGTTNGEETTETAEEISFWYMGDGNEQVQPVLDDFTEETGIHVNVQSIPWSSAHDRLLTAVASGEGPDVVQLGTTWMSEFVDAGALEDITEYTESVEALNPENFFEGNVNTTEFDNSYYAIPWYTETRALYYREDLLSEVGYDEAPQTWEELKDAADQLADRGDNYYGFNVDGADQSFHFMFARQNGAELLSENEDPLFTESEFSETIEYLNSFVVDGASPAQDLGLDISQTFGGEGYVPMFISGPWMISIINESAPDIEGQWATAPLPEGPENNLSNTGGANLAVWNGSENVDEAIQLIEFISLPENQLTFFETSSSLPATMSAWEDEALSGDHIETFGTQLENSEHMPLLPEWEQVAQTFLSYWEQISVGGSDIQDALDSFNQEAANILD